MCAASLTSLCSTWILCVFYVLLKLHFLRKFEIQKLSCIISLTHTRTQPRLETIEHRCLQIQCKKGKRRRKWDEKKKRRQKLAASKSEKSVVVWQIVVDTIYFHIFVSRRSLTLSLPHTHRFIWHDSQFPNKIDSRWPIVMLVELLHEIWTIVVLLMALVSTTTRRVICSTCKWWSIAKNEAKKTNEFCKSNASLTFKCVSRLALIQRKWATKGNGENKQQKKRKKWCEKQQEKEKKNTWTTIIDFYFAISLCHRTSLDVICVRVCVSVDTSEPDRARSTCHRIPFMNMMTPCEIELQTEMAMNERNDTNNNKINIYTRRKTSLCRSHTNMYDEMSRSSGIRHK